MRRTRVVIATVTALGLFGPVGLAMADDLPEPSQGCEHAAEGKNKHCDAQTTFGFSSQNDENPDPGHDPDPDHDGVQTRTNTPLDNCPDAYNPKQGDYDRDGIGNVCDHALDNPAEGDGVCDADAALCGEPDLRIDDDADDPKYVNDTDGDGFGDEDEDGVGASD
jgi:hypothetical protein